MKRFFKKNKKGFTLVELMVVVAIIGILVAVAVPAYSGITDKANLSACQANQRTIESSALQYYIANSKYPTDVASLVTGTPKYLVSAPHCPSDTAETKSEYAIGADGAVKCANAEAKIAAAHNVAR